MADVLPSVAPLPADAIALHVGIHKTGTTALQAALADSRPQLKRHGVLYPGRRSAHHGAAQAVLQRESVGTSRRGVSPHPWAFERVARQARRHAGRVIISSEAFCEADDQIAARTVAGLGRDRTHVVIALRNLSGLLYSTWQQYLKAGRTRSYDRWLEAILDPDYDGSVTPSFWRRNDHGALVNRWADIVGPQRVTVLVLEDVAPGALFIAVSELLALPPEILTSRMNPSSNRSMTAQEAELVRRLNRAVKGTMDWPDYESLIRNGIIPAITGGRVPGADEPRPRTPEWALDSVAERAARDVAMIRASGAAVLGNLDALARRGRSTPPVAGSVLDQLPTDAVVAVLAGAVMSKAGEAGRGSRLDPVRVVRNRVVRRLT